MLGAFYLGEEYEARTFHELPLPINFSPLPSQLDFDQPSYETDSLSFFVDGTWHITDRARISAGVRRTEDEIDEYHKNTFLVLVPDPVVAFQLCDQGTKKD